MPGGESLGVVIAGDIPFLRVLLKMAIEDAGLDVLAETTNATELLDTCIKMNPDIVLLDLDLSESDNIRIVEDLLDIDPGISIIAMTELVDGECEKMLASGARAFLQKPFSMYDLIDLIRKVAPDQRLRAPL
ncbi:MAG: response regulator [Promethearchaeota archaeon]